MWFKKFSNSLQRKIFRPNYSTSFRQLDLYRVNRHKLSFLPNLMMFAMLLAAVGSLYWYFRPISEVQSIRAFATSEIIKSEVKKQNFKTNLQDIIDPGTGGLAQEKQVNSSNSWDVTTASDSKRVENITYYLSHDCQNLAQKSCQFWSLNNLNGSLKLLNQDLAEGNIKLEKSGSIILSATAQPGKTNAIYLIQNLQNDQIKLLEFDLQSQSITAATALDKNSKEYQELIN